MDIIIAFGSNLRQLDLNFDKVAMCNEYQLWQNLSKLTKPRLVFIHAQEYTYVYAENLDEWLGVNAKFNVTGLILLLKTCTKLKRFRFRCWSNAEDITTKDEKEQIRIVVADKSSSLSFVVK